MRVTAAVGAILAVVVGVCALSVVHAVETSRYTDIGTSALSVLVDKGVKVVDIRRADEWRETGVIPGSKLITAFDARGRLNPQFASEFKSFVDGDEEVVIICRSGNRSEALSRILSAQAGYTRVYNVSGGISNWIDSGNRTEPCPVC